MFNKQNQGEVFNEFETVIGPSVKVKGDFNGQGNIIVEGVVDGNLKTNGNLEVGKTAKITANIEAKEAKIGGHVSGNVKIKGFLEVTATAKIFGDIEASSLSIERGAIFNGKCVMTTGVEEVKKIKVA
ncbi:polymer-forming cytoskeletal protein [Patescibacteria group bacterium]|nr:polymer-forming cytoskeletal protein [Patescibacteria group bacterium]MBU1663203.1 polymer-forming cytoskeletal protein [Patescibacteria group bacterium]MBU1933632.1 polymer-forming cytoskeletal protein [Patescibacteria group bacterium]MBU2007786.1 polymer-forming cytoskeletal protein [Patescibacteria group bacterium]MBU2263971.1 polymer-forming cytoskeletal protein [Patescibacteria group bacterium]